MKVVLARLEAKHAPAMLKWLRDPDVSGNLGLRSVPTLAKTRAFIASAATDPTVCARAVLLDDAHVGTVVLDRLDRAIGTARFHIYIGAPSARGCGVGTRATASALEIAFTELALHKVWLTVHARNTAALRAYATAGFLVEGIHRDEFLLGDERVGEIYMGILADEWQRRREPTRSPR